MTKLDVYEFTMLLTNAKKGNQLSVFSDRTDEASATQYFQVIYYLLYFILIINNNDYNNIIDLTNV